MKINYFTGGSGLKQNKERFTNTNEVSVIKKFPLGGYPQKVLFEGLKKTNPIMLTLHGGPGLPIPFSVGCRGLFPEITEKYILVSWDQLGCGANNHSLSEEFTINHFVEMVGELIHQIKMEYPSNDLIIFGMSWGSVLAAKTAKRYPDLIDQAVTYGQVSKDIFFNPETFQALEDANLPLKKRRTLEKLQQTSSYDKRDGLKISQMIRKYTNGYSGINEDKAASKAMILSLLNSPDYRLRDFIALFVNGFSKNKNLWEELLSIDLTTTLSEITIPYTIFQGEYDLVTPSKPISEIILLSENSLLQMKTISGCGHIPDEQVIEEVIELLDNKLNE